MKTKFVGNRYGVGLAVGLIVALSACDVIEEADDVDDVGVDDVSVHEDAGADADQGGHSDVGDPNGADVDPDDGDVGTDDGDVDSDDGDVGSDDAEIGEDVTDLINGCDPGATPFGAGDGSMLSPYLICSVAHLAAMATESDVQGNSFELVHDLDLANITNSPIIGSSSQPFTGIFDGGGFTIANITINHDRDDVGLFGVVGEFGEVRDLVLEGVDVQGEFQVGALVGTNEGTITNIEVSGEVRGNGQVGGILGVCDGEVSELTSTVNVAGEANQIGGLIGYKASGTITEAQGTGSVSGVAQVGGAIGRAIDATIEEILADVEVTASSTHGGGLIGFARDTHLQNVESNGDVQGEEDAVGGLVGTFDGSDCSITNALASGNVETTSDFAGGLVGANHCEITDSVATGDVQGQTAVGGLVGSNLSESVISGSRAEGDVQGEQLVGGFAGSNGGEIRESAALGNVSGGLSMIGGFVGTSDGAPLGDKSLIERSYAAGDVSGETDNIGGFAGNITNAIIQDSYAVGSVSGDAEQVGGFLGFNDLGGELHRVYATGTVEGSSRIGGLVGRNRGSVVNAYWDTDTSEESTAVGFGTSEGTGRETAEFDDMFLFEEWDFVDRWEIGEAPDGHQRPILQWQE